MDPGSRASNEVNNGATWRTGARRRCGHMPDYSAHLFLVVAAAESEGRRPEIFGIARTCCSARIRVPLVSDERREFDYPRKRKWTERRRAVRDADDEAAAATAAARRDVGARAR